jgi:hypothetical protein
MIYFFFRNYEGGKQLDTRKKQEKPKRLILLMNLSAKI